MNGGNAGGAAHQKYLSQLRSSDSRVIQGGLDGQSGAFHQMLGELVEPGSSQRHLHMQGPISVLSDVGQVHAGVLRGGQFLLGLFRRFPHTLHGGGIPAEIHMVFTFEFGHQEIGHAVVKVVAAQVVVAAGGQHFDDTLANFNDGHVKGTAAQIIDHDLLGRAVVQTVGQSRTGGLVDDAQYVQTSNLARVLGGLALDVIEIGGDGDDCVGDRLSQIILRVLSQLAQDHGTDFLGVEVFTVNTGVPVGAHVPLDGTDGSGAVGGCLTSGRTAHQTFSGCGEAHYAGGGAFSFVVGNDNGLAALHDGDTAVCGAQVNSDCFAHDYIRSFPVLRYICRNCRRNSAHTCSCRISAYPWLPC